MKSWGRKIKNESGVTLVELLAAIAILSIIVTAFLAFFIQAANTNSQTDDVNEATFLAQEEMERVTQYATESSVEAYVQPENKNGFEILTNINKVDDSELYKVVVEVTKGGKTRAKMETQLPFENETDDEADE